MHGVANCTSTLLCLFHAHRSLQSVNICEHRILLDKSGEDPGNGQIAIDMIEVVMFGAWFGVLPYQRHF
jgi:hypothetical protein